MKYKYNLNDFVSGIYEIKNTTKNIIYIGSSKNIENRIKVHFDLLGNGKHQNKEMQADYTNGDIFEWKIIIKMPPVIDKELKTWEKIEINRRREKGIKLYNILNMSGHYYAEKDSIIYDLADLFLQEKLNIRLGNLLNQCPASYNMYYEIAKNPENENEIRKYYYDTIQYENKDRYYLENKKIHFFEYLEQKEKG